MSLQHLSYMCWECQQKQCQYSWDGERYKKFHLFPRQQCWLQLTRNHFFCHCQMGAGKHLLANIDIVWGIFFPHRSVICKPKTWERLGFQTLSNARILSLFIPVMAPWQVTLCVCGLWFICLFISG